MDIGGDDGQFVHSQRQEVETKPLGSFSCGGDSEGGEEAQTRLMLLRTVGEWVGSLYLEAASPNPSSVSRCVNT